MLGLFVFSAIFFGFIYDPKTMIRIRWNGGTMLILKDTENEITLRPVDLKRCPDVKLHKDVVILGLFLPGTDKKFIPSVLFRDTERSCKLNPGLFYYSIKEGDGGLYLNLKKPIGEGYFCVALDSILEPKTVLIRWE